MTNYAISTQDWSGEANVDVSIVNWSTQATTDIYLDNQNSKREINSSLKNDADVSKSKRLKCNFGFCYFGIQPVGGGFIVDAILAQEWIDENSMNAKVIKGSLGIVVKTVFGDTFFFSPILVLPGS